MDDWATVFQTADPARLAFAESILEQANIPHWVRNQGIQDLFALGRVGLGHSPVVGPIEIVVDRSREQQALEWFEGMGPEASGDAENEEDATPRRSRVLRVFIWLYLAMILGSLAWSIVENSTEAVLLGILLAVLFPFAMCVILLRARLQARGYGWAGYDDALTLLLNLGWSAYAVPPASEVEPLPGLGPDADSLISFQRNLSQLKKKSRRRLDDRPSGTSE